MLSDYTFIGIFVVVAIAFPIVALALAFLIRPKKPDAVKSSTYECGLETIGETWVQFRVQYYMPSFSSFLTSRPFFFTLGR